MEMIIPDVNNLKEEVLFWFSFRGFSPWCVGFVAFGPVARQHIIVGMALWSKSACSWWLGIKE
jgi:hypothetical protein